LLSIAQNQSIIVTVGASGNIRTSTDGITWTTRTSGTTRQLNDIIWTGTQFVVVGATGTITTSTDGITWTTRTSGTTSALTGVAYNGNIHIALINSTSILTSNDGITWALTTITYGGGSNPSKVTWGNNLFIISAGSGNTFPRSSDGLTWITSVNAPENPSPNRVRWTGTQFVAAASGGRVYTSTDGITWVIRISTNTRQSNSGLNGVAFNAERIIVVGENALIVTSPPPTTPLSILTD
jgi:hypothetical protein